MPTETAMLPCKWCEHARPHDVPFYLSGHAEPLPLCEVGPCDCMEYVPDDSPRAKAHAALDEAIRRVRRRGAGFRHENEQIVMGCLYEPIIAAAREPEEARHA